MLPFLRGTESETLFGASTSAQLAKKKTLAPVWKIICAHVTSYATSRLGDAHRKLTVVANIIVKVLSN
jgi:hypothetical protein